MKEIKIVTGPQDIVKEINNTNHNLEYLRGKHNGLVNYTMNGFIVGLIFGALAAWEIRKLKKAVGNTPTYESTKNSIADIHDQLDAQESKLLQLELELEDLKKG